jgi:flagellar hook assembly protein FlgD
VEYQLSQSEQVEIEIYNVQGQFVKQLIKEKQSAGTHIIHFNASSLSSGVYFFSIKIGNRIHEIQKAVYLK